MIARIILAVAGIFILANAAMAQDTKPARRAVVVELFTSQGCPNCVKANALLANLSQRDEVVALSFAVDYWDYLGWRDTFAMPAFTERQYTYGKALKSPRVYTPQIIVDGRKIYRGVRQSNVRKAVDKRLHDMDSQAPDVQAHLNEKGELVLDINGPAATNVSVWLAAYTPGEQTVEVKAGENKGKQLVQVNMVAGLTKLADWTGGHTRMVLPMPEEGGCAILLQAGNQGHILAATKVES
jgi:hypothetical protein